MVNIILISKLLNDGNFFLKALEFPESPKINDFVTILDFIDKKSKLNLEEYLIKENKISAGRVISRSWGFDQNKLSLFVVLDFEEED